MAEQARDTECRRHGPLAVGGDEHVAGAGTCHAVVGYRQLLEHRGDPGCCEIGGEMPSEVVVGDGAIPVGPAGRIAEVVGEIHADGLGGADINHAARGGRAVVVGCNRGVLAAAEVPVGDVGFGRQHREGDGVGADPARGD